MTTARWRTHQEPEIHGLRGIAPLYDFEELDQQKKAARATAEKGSVLADVTVREPQLAGLTAQLEALRAKLAKTFT